MSEIVNLRSLFTVLVQRAYDAERRMLDALPAMREAAASAELRHAFQLHLEETMLHRDRLLNVFEWIKEKPKTDTSHAVKGAIKDGESAILLDLVDADAAVKDAALIAAAQQVEHIEIAIYGTLLAWATALDERQAMQAFELTLEEEKNADTVLSGFAGTLNLRAAHAE